MKIQKRPFVHNPFLFAISGGFVRNFGGVFAILFEALFIEIKEEIHHFAVLGGGVRGTKSVNKLVVNKLAFPKNVASLKEMASSHILALQTHSHVCC